MTDVVTPGEGEQHGGLAAPARPGSAGTQTEEEGGPLRSTHIRTPTYWGNTEPTEERSHSHLMVHVGASNLAPDVSPPTSLRKSRSPEL